MSEDTHYANDRKETALAVVGDGYAFNDQCENTYDSQTQDAASDIVVDDFEDEAYAESTNSGALTSLASDVQRGVIENGRVYPSYGRHEYAMPIDEPELDRNDLQHAKFLLLLNNNLHLAPVPSSATRILDVGTGTGIWSIDMGDTFPAAEIIGTDIAPIQPSWVPPNVQFIIEDAEATWTFSPSSFDFIFVRELSFAIRDWPRLISQAFTALKPGGWLELSSTYPITYCDDGSLDLQTSYFVESVRIYMEIAKAMGSNFEAPHSWAQQMTDIGFVDIQKHSVKMPMGPWAKDKRLKMVGVFELAQLNQGYEAFMIRGWTQVLKRRPEELYGLIAEGRKEINNRKHHTYAHFIVVTGRKPPIP